MGDRIYLNFNLSILRPVFAGGVISAVLVAAACSASAEGPGTGDDVPTPAPNAVQEVTPTEAPVVVPVANQQDDIPAGVPVTPPVETPADEPVADEAPAEAPRVLWMRTSHAGPGVVTIRFATNVPATATVMAMTNQVGPAHFYSEDLPMGTEHVTSVPASAFGRYQVRVENEAGDVARGELRFESDPMGLDWGTGGAAPKLVAPNAKQLNITYAFPQGHPSKLGFDGTVHLFMTDASCTTADTCEGELVGSALESPAKGNAQLESHEVIASIPGSAFDYQVVVGQPLNEVSSMMVFIQLEIDGHDLPKVNFNGPKVIKN